MKIPLTILLLLFAMLVRGQIDQVKNDSVTIEVLSSKVKRHKIRYELLIKETGQIVYSYCRCDQKRQNGELVRVAKKDLIYD